jgi:DNA-binding transcriptional regulator YiaG
MTLSGATVPKVATAVSTNTSTIALADQLNHLRQRVPVSERDVTAATGADAATVSAWLERRAAPAGEQAARLNELIAVVDMLEESTRPEAIGPWLHREIPALKGRTPAAMIAAGGYEQVYEIAAELAAGVFT